jgi:actin-related protein
MAEDEFLGAKPVVIDNGTGLSKNGYAGEDQPRSVWPTLIGYPRYESIMTDVDHYTRDYYIGEEAINLRGVLRLVYPITHGKIDDWRCCLLKHHSTHEKTESAWHL